MPLPKFATLLLLEADAPDGARMTDSLGEARAADADVPDGTGTTDTSGKAGVANAPGGTGKIDTSGRAGVPVADVPSGTASGRTDSSGKAASGAVDPLGKAGTTEPPEQEHGCSTSCWKGKSWAI